ncbi:MAG: hypothetical protein GF401_05375 [Chitinivibrionales bacterium]|nr:hypothetical protein [Chitinivibrionales bacterium]
MIKGTHIEWLGMSIEVPEDWEITRHSVNRGRGKLIFIDRRHQRLQFAWTRCARRPAEKRIFDDFRARDKEEDPTCVISDIYHRGPWRLYRRKQGEASITRAGSYETRSKRWLDLVFSWPEGCDERVEEMVLKGCCSQKSDAPVTRWCAFGIDMKTPSDWQIHSTEALPGATTFVFGGNGSSITVRRRAMAPFRHKGTIGDYLVKETGRKKDALVYQQDNGHEICQVQTRESVFKPRWLRGKRKVTSDYAWICDRKETIFHVTLDSYDKKPVECSKMKVECCGRG